MLDPMTLTVCSEHMICGLGTIQYVCTHHSGKAQHGIPVLLVFHETIAVMGGNGESPGVKLSSGSG
jgi:hypothetical protein